MECRGTRGGARCRTGRWHLTGRPNGRFRGGQGGQAFAGRWLGGGRRLRGLVPNKDSLVGRWARLSCRRTGIAAGDRNQLGCPDPQDDCAEDDTGGSTRQPPRPGQSAAHHDRPARWHGRPAGIDGRQEIQRDHRLSAGWAHRCMDGEVSRWVAIGSAVQPCLESTVSLVHREEASEVIARDAIPRTRVASGPAAGADAPAWPPAELAMASR